jgi:hypothetical protein
MHCLFLLVLYFLRRAFGELRLFGWVSLWARLVVPMYLGALYAFFYKIFTTYKKKKHLES